MQFMACVQGLITCHANYIVRIYLPALGGDCCSSGLQSEPSLDTFSASRSPTSTNIDGVNNLRTRTTRLHQSDIFTFILTFISRESFGLTRATFQVALRLYHGRVAATKAAVV